MLSITRKFTGNKVFLSPFKVKMDDSGDMLTHALLVSATLLHHQDDFCWKGIQFASPTIHRPVIEPAK